MTQGIEYGFILFVDLFASIKEFESLWVFFFSSPHVGVGASLLQLELPAFSKRQILDIRDPGEDPSSLAE